MSAQQKVIVIQAPHAPFAIQSAAPARGEVLVKVMAVGLNPMDWWRRQMDFMIDGYPAILGSDIAGVIEQVGECVAGFQKGDKVLAATLGGGYQKYVALPAKPGNVTFDEAATFPITFCTACVGLFAPAPIGVGLNPAFSFDKPQQGKSALVIGAGTSVGQFAVQLLRFLGFTRIVTYASAAHTTYLTKLGATAVIDSAAVSLAALPGAVPAVDVVYDCTFGAAPDAAQSVNAAFDCAEPGGKVVTANPRAQLDSGRTETEKQVELCRAQGYYYGPDVLAPQNKDMAGYLAQAAHSVFGRVLVQRLPQMLEQGLVEANRIEVLPGGLAGVVGGLGRWEKGTVSGVKLVGHPHETRIP